MIKIKYIVQSKYIKKKKGPKSRSIVNYLCSYLLTSEQNIICVVGIYDKSIYF